MAATTIACFHSTEPGVAAGVGEGADLEVSDGSADNGAPREAAEGVGESGTDKSAPKEAAEGVGERGTEGSAEVVKTCRAVSDEAGGFCRP